MCFGIKCLLVLMVIICCLLLVLISVCDGMSSIGLLVVLSCNQVFMFGFSVLLVLLIFRCSCSVWVVVFMSGSSVYLWMVSVLFGCVGMVRVNCEVFFISQVIDFGIVVVIYIGFIF